jgi:predicted metal-dependent hydrolase
MSMHTPQDLTITPRDRRFGRGAVQEHWWMDGDPVGTAFYNALSVTFPKGEAFFVESVRMFRDGAPPKLAAEIKAFVTQEVMHSREHVQFNKRALEAGYDLSGLEARVEWRLSITKDRPPIVNLAATMCLEHFTAILANQLLRNPGHLDKADAENAALWRWHSIEEIEHKGVAYDTWLHATRGLSRWRRWKIKAKVMLFVTRNFVVDRSIGTLELLRQDGITGFAAWRRMLWFAWVRPGMLRKILGAWVAFFLPGFHPWKHDDRHLIAKAESDYEAARLPAAAAA